MDIILYVLASIPYGEDERFEIDHFVGSRNFSSKFTNS